MLDLTHLGPVDTALAVASVRHEPEQLAKLLRRFAREGVNHVQLWLEPNTMAGSTPSRPCLNYSTTNSPVADSAYKSC